MPSVITANRLTDGIVVYFAPDGGWVEDIARARFAETEGETAALEAQANKAVKDRIVVAMYPMPVEIKDGAVDALRSIEGVTSVAVEDQDQAQVVVVQAATGHEPTHAILERLQGVSLGRVTTREPTLEDAYVALVTEQPVAADG